MRRSALWLGGVVCCSMLAACERAQRDSAPNPPPQYSEDAAPLTVLAKGEDPKDLVYWFDATASTLHIMQPERLVQLVADGVTREVEWEQGAPLARIRFASTDARGPMEFDAEVKIAGADDTLDYHIVSASVGDLRMLTRLRELATAAEYLEACSSDPTLIWQSAPGGTVGLRLAGRQHKYYMGTGTAMGPEYVENTARMRWYSDKNCNNRISETFFGQHWVSSVLPFPG